MTKRTRPSRSYLEFIELTDEYYCPDARHKTRYGLFRCTFNGPGCTKTTKQFPGDVRRRKAISCGCHKNYRLKVSPIRRIDYTNKTVGRFQIRSYLRTKPYGHVSVAVWSAVCLECGQDIEIDSVGIHRDSSPCNCRRKSGCRSREARRSRARRTREERLLQQMKT